MAVALVAGVACSGDSAGPSVAASAGESTPGELRVVTTLYPLGYFAGRIGGDAVEVVNLVAPGTGAHDFDPTPGDIRKLAEADVLVYNGHGFEAWVERALDALGAADLAVVEAGRELSTTEAGRNGFVDANDPGPDAELVSAAAGDEHDNGTDPHIWLDPSKAAEQVELIRDGLGSADPRLADRFAKNASRLIEELHELDGRFEHGLAACEREFFVTSHDAFGYLARRYGLEQVSVAGLSPEAEATPRELARLADRVAEAGVTHLLVEPIVDVREAETLAREVGASLLPLHPLESLTRAESDRGETYFTLMEANLRSLRTALECR